MTPADFATKPTLRGRLVTLRPFRDGDAEVMAGVLTDPEVRLLTGSLDTTAEAHRSHPLDDRMRAGRPGWRTTHEVLDHSPRARRVYEKVGYVVTGHRDAAYELDREPVGATDMVLDATIWCAGSTSTPPERLAS
jgi:hypothetical protein